MPEQLIAQALAALKQDRFKEARDHIESYARLKPLELQHYLIRGLAELALAEWAAAAKTFSAAVSKYPDQPQLWSNLGQAQENSGDLKVAAQSYEQSLKLKPDQGEVCGNLSNAYRLLGRFAEAEAFARKAAPKVQALNVLGLALGKQGKFAEAARAFNEALRLEPDNTLVLGNLANLAVDQLNFAVAWPLYAMARSHGNLPIIVRDEGMARLLAGDYATGWQLYEDRLKLPRALRVHPTCPRYNGESLAGKKILLISEQGFGDTIQFCRYGALLAPMGAELIWAVQKPLARLLAANVAGRVCTESDPLPETDYYLPLLSLPFATGKISLADAPPMPCLRWAEKIKLPVSAKSKKIGLAWTGSLTHERDHERSIPLAQFASLLEQIDAQFYAPFVGAGLEQIINQPIIKLDHLIEDFADTAALLQQMDCLITVDTAVAHLAGALGVKTFLLLPHCPDWRWGTEGASTAWYPSLTLLRQPKYGDWKTAIATLRESMKKGF